MNPERWKKIKDIFHPAVDLPLVERRRFIDEHCEGDDELRDEVLALLAANEESPISFEKSAHTVTEFVTGLEEEDMVGRQIGAYRVEREIGRGGMGRVFLARRADDEFDKVVAIKLIKRGFDTDEIISRFKHERRILAALDHPYITRLFDGGTTEDGRPYLVMEYVEGLPLTRYCDEKRLSIDERLKLFLKVCEAVTYAHINLVVHRDLKPGNILITSDGNPKLLDFGVAKLLMSDGIHTQRTEEMARAMTPCYASPEQIRNEKITIPSDVYSLGVILYELLTGSRPFRLRSMKAEEMARVIAEVPPMLPSTVITRGDGSIGRSEAGAPTRSQAIAQARGTTVERLKRKLRGDLDNIILMAIRKEPDRRYVSSFRLAIDIQNYLAGLPVLARKDSVGYRAGKFVQRNKAGVVAGVGIAASLIAGFVAVSRQAKRAQRERDRAIDAARRAKAVNRFTKKVLSSAQPGNRGRDVKLIELMEEIEQGLQTDFPNQSHEMADLLATLGLTHLSLGTFDKAERAFSDSLEIRRRLFPRLSVEVAEGFWNYGKILHAKGLLKDAEPYYREAERIFREVRGPMSVRRASVISDLAHLVALTGRHEESIDLHRGALTLRRKALGPDHPDVALSLGEMGNVLAMSMSRFAESVPYQREALRIMRLHHKGDHPEIAKFLLYLGSGLHRDDPAAAIDFAKQSLEMRQRLFEPSHPDIAWANYNVGYYLVREGKGSEAVRYAKDVVKMVVAGLPKEHAVVNSSYLLLGRGHLLEGDYAAAMRAFDECLALRKATLPADHWLLATTESFRGYTLALSGRVEDGVELMAASVSTLVEKLGEDHAQTKEARERLSEFQPA